MHPASFSAFVDEMEKIALSLKKITDVSTAAFNKGIVGHRVPVKMGDPDTMGKIREMVARRGKKAKNPVTKLQAALADRKLRIAQHGTFESSSVGEHIHRETQNWASESPRVLAERLRDPNSRASVNVVSNRPHRWEYHRNYLGQPFQRPGTVWAGKGVPHPTVENQRAAALAMPLHQSAAVPQRPTTTTTMPPARFPPVTTQVPTPAPSPAPTPAAPVQRRPFVSRTPVVPQQQPGVAF